MNRLRTSCLFLGEKLRTKEEERQKERKEGWKKMKEEDIWQILCLCGGVRISPLSVRHNRRNKSPFRCIYLMGRDYLHT